MRRDLDHVLTRAEALDFARRVMELRAQGLSTRDVGRRLGVAVSTLNERLRRAREAIARRRVARGPKL